MISIIHDDYRRRKNELVGHSDALVIYDPPYDKWIGAIPIEAESSIAFTSPQRRHETESCLGKPRNELVWHFRDGRWVSNNLPRITHNYIYLYGRSSSAAVGAAQAVKTVKKGNQKIGKDDLGPRLFTTKPRKHLNSVLEYPRNMRRGYWGKPLGLIRNLVEWVNPSIVLDPYMGTGAIGAACMELGVDYIGVEIEASVFRNAESNLKAIGDVRVQT